LTGQEISWLRWKLKVHYIHNSLALITIISYVCNVNSLASTLRGLEPISLSTLSGNTDDDPAINAGPGINLYISQCPQCSWDLQTGVYWIWITLVQIKRYLKVQNRWKFTWKQDWSDQMHQRQGRLVVKMLAVHSCLRHSYYNCCEGAQNIIGV
jgi:hypothetical protein